MIAEETNSKGFSPMIVKAYKEGQLGILTVWDCFEDEIALVKEESRPRVEKILILTEIWEQMMGLSGGRSSLESDNLNSEIIKMCELPRRSDIRENIDEGLLEVARVARRYNLKVLFPIFEMFENVKLRNKAVCSYSGFVS